MKYIIFETCDERQTVRIFDDIVDHSDVARQTGLKVISAGKLSMNADFGCSSGSVTLGLSYSREQSAQDAKDIQSLNSL